MCAQLLEEDGEFVVKESRSINFIAGGVLILIFTISVLVADLDLVNFMFVLCIFLIPGAIAIARGRRNITLMVINKSGFYYAGRLVTDWKLFYDAVVFEKPRGRRIKDSFVLDLRYYSNDYSLIYTKRIPLTNFQDKGDEEILEAIQFYCNAGRLIPGQ